MRPVNDAPDIAMLDRIEMQIVDAPGESLGIENGRLPEAPSPQRALAISARGEFKTQSSQSHSEITLDQAPAHRIAIIAIRQAHDGMQVIRQDDQRDQTEWMNLTHTEYRSQQLVDVIDKDRGRPISKRDREEIGPAGNAFATVVDHANSVIWRDAMFRQSNASTRIG